MTILESLCSIKINPVLYYSVKAVFQVNTVNMQIPHPIFCITETQAIWEAEHQSFAFSSFSY